MAKRVKFARAAPCFLFLLPAVLLAGDGVLYEIRPPSRISVSCGPYCGDSIPQPLAGTFLLAPDPMVADGFLISEVNWTSGPTRIGGSGVYRRRIGDSSTAVLALAIDGQATSLGGGGCEQCPSSTVEWPAIDISLSGPPVGEMSYDLHVVAAPKVEYVRYELRSGSSYDILFMGTVSFPLAGTFLLGKIEEANGFSMYRIDSIAFRGVPPAADSQWKIGGSGTWVRGSAAQTGQRGEIHVSVAGGGPYIHKVISQSVLAPMPAIDLTASCDASDLEHIVYDLHIVAEPGNSVAFRRGDANGDGAVDLSDAVFTLAAMFLGAGPPPCEAAADADADGKSDIADAVSILRYLFLGGGEPAFPGPRECGISGDPAESTEGCRYPICDGWPGPEWFTF